MIVVYEKSMKKFATLLAGDLGINSLELNITKFSNDEFYFKFPEIQDRHILMIFPNIGKINENLILLFLIISNLKTPRTIDIFIPYIPYSRQDESKSFNFILNNLKSLNVRKIITIDIHKDNKNQDIVNILPHELFGNRVSQDDVVIVAPDIGAIPRAKAFADYLKTDLIVIDKHTGSIQNSKFISNRNCLIIDDLVDTGKTLRFASSILKSNGAKSIKSIVSNYARDNLIEFHSEIAQIIRSVSE